MDERFARDERGSMAEKFAIAAGLVGLASLFLGSTVEQMASTGQLPTIAFLLPDQYVASRSDADKNFNGIDYTATGSVSGRVVLDPCTGRQKSE